jgi:hypothetical protein
MNIFASLIVVAALGCGGSKSPPPAMAAKPAVVAPVDNRCTAPQRWTEPGCSAPDGPFQAGCFVTCNKGGATEAERLDQSKCPAGSTCTKVMSKPLNASASDVCGQEDYLCLPRS